jgi:phosphohistidine phosphatase SixA
MGAMQRIHVVMLLLASLMASTAATAADTALWSKLKQGGYVILMRHGATDSMTHSTNPNADFDNCVGQNNLSPEAQMEAARVGRALKKKHIPVGDVLAGPYCRTQDTARIAFGKVKVWDALDLQTTLPEDEAAKRTATVAARVGAYQGPKNLVLVTHKPNIDALTFELLEPDEMLILRPGGTSLFSVVGRLTPQDLPR